MDEVRAMTHAGETAGRAVAAAEHKLADAADTIRPTVESVGRRARKAAAKLKPVVDEPPTPQRRGRRWPWLLGIAIAAAGTVLVIRKRQNRPTEPTLVPDDEENYTTGNGSAPMPRQEQPNGQLNRQN
jgi:hypothetical protein